MEQEISGDRRLLLLIFVLLGGGVLRCWNINQSLWWDEIWSTMPYVRAASVWDIFTSLGYYFNNHLLYSLLGRGSVAIFGESEFTVRLPALVMGLLGVLALFRCAEVFLGTRSAVIAALLLAVSPFHIDHSSEARGYAGLALFSILSSFYFLKGIKANELKSWVYFLCFTVLGFCSHAFMIAVSVSQCVTVLLVLGARKWRSLKVNISPRAPRNFFVCLFGVGVITLIVYSPLLATFYENMGKVRYVEVTRIPFVLSVLNSFFPGIKGVIGVCVYGVLFCVGMYPIFRKDVMLCVYLAVMFFLPLSLYLLINPMFVFERYFIFALPFMLLVLSEGMVRLADNFRGAIRSLLVLTLLMVTLYVQLPFIEKVLHQDRQNYREAVQYVEGEREGKSDALLFSIGYAGEHFSYYASGAEIAIPETLDELSDLMQGKNHVWCLITAWLPELCPPYEDKALYSERPGQVDIFNYVETHFTRVKQFSSKYPVVIYYWES